MLSQKARYALRALVELARADGAQTVLITSDGVFSMDGTVAPLDRLTALAKLGQRS